MQLREREIGRGEILHALVCALIIGTAIAGYFFIDKTTNKETYRVLMQRVQSFAVLFDPAEVSQLTLSDADLTLPAYQDLKSKLIALKGQNSDARFVYLMAKRGDQVYFMADSEDPSSEGYSPPGQEYTEASPVLLSGWEPGKKSVMEIYADRWGNWISGLAPIVNASGTTIALIGMDQGAEEHQLLFLTEVGLILLAAATLLLLVGLLYFLERQEQDLVNMKNDFVAVASHELRSPLSSLRWDLSELQHDSALPEKERGIIDNLYKRVCVLIERTGALLQVTAVDHGAMRPDEMKRVDIAPEISAALSRAKEAAMAKQITIHALGSLQEPMLLRGNRTHLRLVFDNLLSNAVKYSPEHSTVTCSVKTISDEHIFSVRDEGMGIPPEDAARIFTGFHRAKNAEASGALGSGFGLYITKKIVDFHGGSITCSSEQGKGSTFTVRLPRAI